MALFNKFFSSRKNNLCKIQEASVGEKVFSLTKDQIHVVLFRECDFRGRKLLFDSRLVQKVPLNTSGSELETSATTKNHQEKYAEISNGFGYRYVKPSSDVGQLGEMIFGSVAMSYRGTSFKIHSLKSPSRLMCSQIFPSPKQRTRTYSSAPTQTFIYNSISSSQSFEQSIRLDDFSASSGNSINDRLSVYSTTSDTALNACESHNSTPLDVPQNGHYLLNSSTRNSVTPNTNRDSGFSGELSNNSACSGPRSFSLSSNFYEGDEAFSCGSLYKRWLRSASASLEHSVSLLNVCSTSDDCLLKPHVRSSKLGLAIIIELSEEHERFLEQFLMEHSTLVESMVWRTRQGVEVAYTRPANFSSLMCEVTENSVQWLVDLLAGPQLNAHMWTTLAPICDKFSVSINNNNSVGYKNVCNGETGRTKSLRYSETCTSLNNLYESSDAFELTFFNFSKYLKSDRSYGTIRSSDDKNVIAEKCISELCELLDNIDIKHTNFFISTLVTAVLTYHLGWVATVLPPTSNDKEKVSRLGNTCNPLWGQLADLYGAIGYPTRMSHTIITGTNKADLITKILNSLTYFIRCSDSRRQYLTRLDTKVENEVVDCICRKESCIPKENYKKYIDHLRDMKIVGFGDVKNTQRFENELKSSCDKIPETIEMHSLDHPQTNENKKPNDGVTNIFKTTKTCSKDLAGMIELEDGTYKTNLYPNLSGLALEESTCLTSDETNFSFKNFNSNGRTMPKFDETLLNKVKNLGICGMQFGEKNHSEKFELTNAAINEKVKKLCRVPTSAILYHRKDSLEDSAEILRASKKVTMEMQTKSVDHVETSKNVVFVLGENEELVGLKKEEKINNDEAKNVTLMGDCAAFSSLNMKSKEILKPSTSWSNLDIHDRLTGSSENKKLKSAFDRSQSAPPEDKNVDSNGRPIETNKYKYAGVKFNIRRYPQIVTNYMRSKNLELPHFSLAEKSIKLNGGDDYAWLESSNLDCQMEEVESLQTPSNASELEFTSDLVTSDSYSGIKESQKVSIRNRLSGGANRSDSGRVEKIVVKEHPLGSKKKGVSESEEDVCSRTEQFKKMKVIELPQPKSREIPTETGAGAINYTSSLMRGIGERYISDMVLQGTSAPKVEWESNLRKDLSLAARHSLLDQPINESIAIVANTDTWEVQLLSSHTYVVDRGCTGVRVGMSQLVANMLESLLHMWKLRTPPEYCVMHIEQRLQEFCALSKAVAELLLATEFCSIDLLTSVLQLEVNDIPLLMAVASTHSPQVMQKYGISFQ